MQKIIYLENPGIHMSCFSSEPGFRKADEVPFLPDDLMLSGTWRNKEIIKLAAGYRPLVPAVLFFKDDKILIKKIAGGYRLWFGEPIKIEDVTPQTDFKKLAARTLQKELVKPNTPLTHIGYSSYPAARTRLEFLVVYAARLSAKRKLAKEEWYDIQQIKDIYFKLDPLSKAIFDAFYEDETLLHTWFCLEKQEKTVDSKSV